MNEQFKCAAALNVLAHRGTCIYYLESDWPSATLTGRVDPRLIEFINCITYPLIPEHKMCNKKLTNADYDVPPIS